uniref:Uncharacterized protein n=1 Tax=Arundo donax TaxID=35708 RepID=A0A0A9AH28_ARUDO
MEVRYAQAVTIQDANAVLTIGMDSRRTRCVAMMGSAYMRTM